MEEIGSVVRIAEVSLQGIEIGVKAGKEGIEVLKRLAVLLYNVMKFASVGRKYVKSSGRTNIKNLREKGKEFGGVIPYTFQSSDEMKDFLKAAKKSGILFCCEAPVYKEGQCKIFVSKQDVDIVQHILENTVYPNAIKRKQSLEGLSKEDAEKEVVENNRSESFTEYIKSSGIMECPQDKFDEINKSYFGDEYEDLEQLKKKLVDNSPEAEQLREVLGKAVHETKLIEEMNSDQFIKMDFNQNQICGKDEDKNIIMVQAKNVPTSIVEIPADRVLVRDNNKLTAVIPKDQEVKELEVTTIQDTKNKNTQARNIRFDNYFNDIKRKEKINKKEKKNKFGGIKIPKVKESLKKGGRTISK